MAKPQDHRGFCFGNWWRRRESNLRQRDRQRLILFHLFLNHLFAVDFKLCFSGERRFFHREGDVRKVIFLGVTLLVLRRNYCDKIVKKLSEKG